jgi:hypothetical protein
VSNTLTGFLLGIMSCVVGFILAVTGFDACRQMPTGPYSKGRAAFVCVFKVPA